MLARGSSWGHCTGRPLGPGDEEGGAELTVWHSAWHHAKAPPWETYPTPFSTSVLLFTNESFCSFPFLSLPLSQPPLRHCTDLLLSIHSQHCPLWEPRSLSLSCVILSLAEAGWSVSTGPQRSTDKQRCVKALGTAGAVGWD